MKRTTPSTNGEPKISDLTVNKIQTLGTLLNRMKLGSQLGLQYSGDRDIYQALGYPDDITYNEYYARYTRQDIAKAIINRPVHYTWKGGVFIKEAGDENKTELEKAWVTLEKELNLKNKFVRLDKLSSIGDYGVLLLGFDDVKDPAGFERPVTGNKKKLLYVKPLGEGHAKIASYVIEPKDPRFGMVEKYDVEYVNPGTSQSTTKLTVHHSRILHVAPELMESEIEGEPVLKSVWNRLIDLEKLVGGSAEMFWRGARPGYQGEIDPEYTLTTDEEAKLQDQLDEYEHNLRRMLLNSGVKFSALEQQVSSPAEHVDVQIQMISAITGIPKRILVGSERGELASGQDLVSWYSLVQTRREEYAEITILRPFIDMMMEYGILPEPTTGEYQIAWTDLFASSDKDQAEVGRIRATSLKEYTTNPMAEFIIPPKAFMKTMLGLDATEIQEITEMSSDEITEEQRAIIEGINDPPEPDTDNE